MLSGKIERVVDAVGSVCGSWHKVGTRWRACEAGCGVFLRLVLVCL